MSKIYLDCAATTPLDPRVLEVMYAVLKNPEDCGNASSKHAWGARAAKLVESAREQVADAIYAAGEGIIFTSGATEANNLAIKGVAEFYKRRGRHIVVCAADHPSILAPCHALEEQGYEITQLKPLKNGQIDLAAYEQLLREDTVLVSTVYVNSETGAIQDAQKLIEIAKKKGIFVHLDAAQAMGKIQIDVKALDVDLMSFSAHKAYGPKGIGALYIRQRPSRVRLSAQLFGGGQEHGLRSGTLPTHQIVGMGLAFELAAKEFETDRQHVNLLNQELRASLSRLEKVVINSDLDCAVPHILNVSFEEIDNNQLLECLPHIALSTGSACHSGSLEPSSVLLAMGVPRPLAAGALRLSMGRFTTKEEIQAAADAIIAAVNTIRGKKS